MALPGNPRGRAIRCICSGDEAGRRRAIGVVAALSRRPRATTPMVRRWSASEMEADQKAGAPGRRDRCDLADVEIHPSLSAGVCRVTVRVLKGLAAGHECPAYSSE